MTHSVDNSESEPEPTEFAPDPNDHAAVQIFVQNWMEERDDLHDEVFDSVQQVMTAILTETDEEYTFTLREMNFFEAGLRWLHQPRSGWIYGFTSE